MVKIKVEQLQLYEIRPNVAVLFYFQYPKHKLIISSLVGAINFSRPFGLWPLTLVCGQLRSLQYPLYATEICPAICWLYPFSLPCKQ